MFGMRDALPLLWYMAVEILLHIWPTSVKSKASLTSQ